MGRKEGTVVPLSRGGTGSPSNTMWPGLRSTSVPRYQVESSSIQPYGHNRHGLKIGGSAPFWRRGSWVPSRTMSPVPRPSYLHAKWHFDPCSLLATINMGRKLGALLPFWGRGTGPPSNTKSPGLRPTSMPSGILIHPANAPQQIWAKNLGRELCPFGGGETGSPSNTMWPDRQDRQRSDSIRRTVLQCRLG